MAIDLTDRYNNTAYMLHPRTRVPNMQVWQLDREDEPVRALVLHHTAGWYERQLGEGAPQEHEIDELDALAADHAARFGIGPGYYYAAFPSGRLYAIGKYGTHRAHTLGNNPQTNNLWNRESLAIVAFGNYEKEPMTRGLKLAIVEGIKEIRQYTDTNLPIYPHGEVPGNPSVSSCPGKNIKEWMKSGYPTTEPRPDHRAEIYVELLKIREGVDRALKLLGA